MYLIHGCIKTDTTDTSDELENIVSKLKQEINDNIYFDEFLKDFKKQGFHATENHPYIRSKFYSLLPLLNYRAYFTIINHLIFPKK